MVLPAGAPQAYELIFSTDDTAWGGSGLNAVGDVRNAEAVLTSDGNADGGEIKRQITVTLPGMSALIFAPVKRRKKT